MREEPVDIIEGGTDWTVNEPILDAPSGWEPVALPQVVAAVPEPVEYYPIEPYEPEPGETNVIVYEPVTQLFEPVPLDEIYPELPKPMAYLAPEPVCNCVTEPCDCDGPTAKTDPLPAPHEPAPPVDGPTKYLGGAQPPPIVKVTSGATDEPMTILGFPWYYAAGAGVGLLLLLSMMDGDK